MKSSTRKKLQKAAPLFVVLLLLIVAAFVYPWSSGPNFETLVQSRVGGGAPMLATTDMATSSYYYEEEAMKMDGDMNLAYGGDTAEGIVLPPGEPNDGVAADVDERMIVRNGNVSLVVVDVEESIEDIKTLTSENKGIVSEANMNQVSDDTRRGWVRIRIPSENFDTVMQAVKDLAVEVESENVNADDVTRQVVDQEARLENLRKEEAQYQEILSSAEEVSDVLQVTEQINRVRWQIESIQTQLTQVKERVSYSTLNISLVDEGDVEIFGVFWSPLVSIKQALRGAVENVVSSIDTLMVLVVNIPLFLLWVAIISLLGWLGWRIAAWGWQKFF